MTLIPALTNALSGLVTAKGAIDVISNNIANVNTEGYTRKIVHTTSITLGNQGAGVEMATLEREIDLKLQKDILTETGVLAQLDTSYEYYQAVQDLFGRPADNNSVSHLISDFQQRLQTLANSPTAAAAMYEAVREAETLANRFSEMSEQLQFLRVEADRAVETAVDEVNDALTRIKNYNDHIQRAAAIGDSTADLEDQRDLALKDLAELIDIRINPQSDGTVMVFTNNGRPLIDVVGARLLTHSSVSALSPEMTYAGGGIQDITWNNRDITTEIQAGKLKALIDMRDTILPNLQSELDTVAKQLMSDLNQMHNRGTGFPTPTTSLTGSRAFVDPLTQEMSYSSGDTLIAVYDSTGNIAAGYQTTVQQLMGDAGPYTMSEVATALDTWLQGLGGVGVGSAGFNSENQLTVNIATVGYGIAFKDLKTVDSPTTGDPTIDLDLAGNNLTFTNAAGNTVTVAVADGDSLNDIRDTINGAGGNFLASVVQTTAGTYKLVVSSTSDVSVSSNVNSVILPGNSWGIAASTALDATIEYGKDVAGSPTVADATVAYGWAGNFTMANGAGETVTVNVAGLTLNQIAAAINADPGDFVAAVVTTDAGTYQLQVTSTNSGNVNLTANSVTLGGSAWAMSSGQPDESVSGFSNFFGLNNLFVTDRENYLFDSPIRTSNWRSGATAQTLTFTDDSFGSNSITVAANSSLQNIADAINADTTISQYVTAAVVPEGSGSRLRITHITNPDYPQDTRELAITGTALSDLGLTQSASGYAGEMTLRADIASDTSLISRGSIVWNSDSAFLRFEMSEGDNASIRAMVEVMSSTNTYQTTGNLGSAKYTHADFAAAMLSVNARGAEVAKQKLEYQQPMNEALEYRQKNLSGVNLDEEMASLIIYQQAYGAAARVISVTEKLMEILEGIVN